MHNTWRICPTMSTPPGRVIIFKAPSDSDKEPGDPYLDVLAAAGFRVSNVPVLDFVFVNLDELRSKLRHPDEYSGIIFSSPRCVKGCELACASGGDESTLAKWANHSNYVVGEATGRLAESLGLSVQGKESGNANNLADVITKNEYTKPFLYPIGSLTNNMFKDRLRKARVEVDDIVTYVTKPHPALKENMSKLSTQLSYDDSVYFLYFSPSGIKFTLPIMEEMNFDLGNVKFVAMGPTTERGLRENGLSVYKTVAKPTPASTLEALTS